MQTTAELRRYRVPLVRCVATYMERLQPCEHQVVHAANPTHAQLLARLTFGAEVAMEPERLD